MPSSAPFSDLKKKYFQRYLESFPAYGGFKYRCPVCGLLFRKLAPFGALQRPNVRCPVCGSAERHRMLFLFLRKFTDFFSSSRKKNVLHFAPEPCLQQVFSRMSNVTYLTADLSSREAGTRMSLTDIAVADKSIDALFCYHVLEHIQDDGRALLEMFRVLKPGGWAAIGIPYDGRMAKTLEDPTITAPEDRARLYGHPGHWRLYGKDFQQKLEQAGFQVRIYQSRDCVGGGNIERFRLCPSEPLFFCVRPS